jgi:hypothetical protein
MSAEQLEKQIAQLPQDELLLLAGWFDRFLGRPAGTEVPAQNDLTEAEQAELLRRREELLSNPAMASAMDDNYFASLKRELADARARKASSG